jgi:hypothetical protein
MQEEGARLPEDENIFRKSAFSLKNRELKLAQTLTF